MRNFYYPKNLKASPTIWFWSVKDFVVLGILVFAAVILGALTHSMTVPCIPMVWAVLTVRMGDSTIWEALRCACRYFITAQQTFHYKGADTVKLSRNQRSTQQQLGIRSFGHYGLQTDKGELLIYTIAPTNISVLSENAAYGRVAEFARLLESLPDMEISITDVSESFDSNKAFLLGRLRAEENPCVRQLLEKDIQFLDTIQVEMSTSRIFMLILRVSSRKEAEVFRTAVEAERVIAAHGFHAHRMRKSETKRMLALYLDAGIEGDRLPDVEGKQFITK